MGLTSMEDNSIHSILGVNHILDYYLLNYYKLVIKDYQKVIQKRGIFSLFENDNHRDAWDKISFALDTKYNRLNYHLLFKK